MTTVERKVYIKQKKNKNIVGVLRFLIRWFRSRKEKQKTRFFPLFLVVGLEKVALPSFLFWQLVMREATQTSLRVSRDSAAHEAELG